MNHKIARQGRRRRLLKDSSLTYQVSGVGIGLFLAQRIVNLHEGKVWASSELGKGSRFTIRIPR